jgi:hypothetical protein
LQQGQDADPGDGEEANPLDADSDTQSKASQDKPEPPNSAESLGGALFVLVGEAVESEGGESSRGDQGRVEQNQASLGEQTVLWYIVS